MSDLPRYPEQFRGYPPVSEEALLAWLAPLGKEIIELTPPVFRELMKERIGWAACWFHLLPASGSFHHFEAGGLLRHSLECVAIFLSDQRESLSEPMLFAGALMALTHDIGKPLSDNVLTDATGRIRRKSFTETPMELSRRIGYRPYFLYWVRNRHGNHDRILPSVAGIRIPIYIRDALAERGAGMAELVMALMGKPSGDAGRRILDGVLRADMKSTSDYTLSFREKFIQGGIREDLALFIAADELRSDRKYECESWNRGNLKERLLGRAEEISDGRENGSEPEKDSEALRRALGFASGTWPAAA